MSKKEQSVYLVDTTTDPVQVKVVGQANFSNCKPLQHFFREMMDKGRTRFLIDLSECTVMDSTFLGIVAGAALDLEEAGGVDMLNVSGRNLEVTRNLGLHHIIRVNPQEGLQVCHVEVEQQRLELLGGMAPASSDVVLKAHENLIRANRDNTHKFEDLMAFLKRETSHEDGELGL